MSHVEQAKERLILARATHLDSLAAKLVEPRVLRVIQPLLAGTLAQFNPYDDDLQRQFVYDRLLAPAVQRARCRRAWVLKGTGALLVSTPWRSSGASQETPG